MPDPRGSASYGRAWLEAIRGDWGGADAEDQIACVDWAVGEGLADPERLGVTGLSYGGFMTQWLIGQSDRFRAAVAANGVANQISAAANCDQGALWTTRLGWERPPADFERLWRQSPLAHAERITTPLLMLQGEADLRCPAADNEQLFVALRALGREVEYVLYPEESHLMQAIGRPDRRIDMLERTRALVPRPRRARPGVGTRRRRVAGRACARAAPNGTDGQCHLACSAPATCAMCESCMHRARLSSLLLVALAALATACGSSSRQAAPGSALQDSLRALASGAPAGDRAYWLGPQFQRAPVSFVSPGWGRFAMLTYRRAGDVVVDVASLAARASVPAGGLPGAHAHAGRSGRRAHLPLARAPERRARSRRPGCAGAHPCARDLPGVAPARRGASELAVPVAEVLGHPQALAGRPDGDLVAVGVDGDAESGLGTVESIRIARERARAVRHLVGALGPGGKQTRSPAASSCSPSGSRRLGVPARTSSHSSSTHS